MAQWIERSTSNRKAAGSSPAVDFLYYYGMDQNPTIIIITAGILFLVGGVTLFNREKSYWSDGSKKILCEDATNSILRWKTQTKQKFGIKGGKYTKKHK